MKFITLRILFIIICGTVLLASPAAGVPVAVLPLQDISAGENDVDLEFSRFLAEALKKNGNEIIDVDTVITFMANNRIRTVGQIETFDAFRARDQLGAGFVLLGTVMQNKEQPDPTLALALSLVRTSDARTVWSYTGSITTAAERKVLGIGEPSSSQEIRPYLLDDILSTWPRQRIREAQQIGAIDLDTVAIRPLKIQPGENVYCRANIRNNWPSNWAPNFFFTVADQVYPATVSPDGQVIEGTWPVGQKDGRFSVYLTVEWAKYQRTERVRLGDYVVDGVQPLVDIDLRGGVQYDGREVFNRKVIVVPRMVVPKPLRRWRLSINYKTDLGDNQFVGDMTGDQRLPGSFVWEGRGYYGDGFYEFTVEVWDQTGYSASASILGEYYRTAPKVELALAAKDEKMVVDMAYASKVPLRYWRMEMWSKEGRLISESEGKQLPVQVEFEMPENGETKDITGFVFIEDVLGKRTRDNLRNLLPELYKTEKPKEKETTGVSERWVDDF